MTPVEWDFKLSISPWFRVGRRRPHGYRHRGHRDLHLHSPRLCKNWIQQAHHHVFSQSHQCKYESDCRKTIFFYEKKCATFDLLISFSENTSWTWSGSGMGIVRWQYMLSALGVTKLNVYSNYEIYNKKAKPGQSGMDMVQLSVHTQ